MKLSGNFREFSLDEGLKYKGNINQKINMINNSFRRKYPTIFTILITAGLSNNVINGILKDIIEFTFKNSTVPPESGGRWSEFENLGGTLTSSPAAVSWGPNGTDVFVKESNNALWHIWRE